MKIKNQVSILITSLLLLLIASACNRVDIPANSVYYWQPAIRLDASEQHFLLEQNVSTVYLHLFDIERDKNGKPMRINTVRFEDRFPKGLKIVPVIFLAPTVVDERMSVDHLADIVVNSATELLVKNGYDIPTELHVDYDWTPETQDSYFLLLKKIGKLIKQRKGGQLSATIRLHQLEMDLPPVDYGVLMLYSTGVNRPATACESVINYESMLPYVQPLKEYDLPLATSLNLYGFDMVYSDNCFRFVARGLDLNDTTRFRKLGANTYECLRYASISLTSNPENLTGRLYPGNIIRHSQPSAGMLDSIASKVSRVRPGDKGNIVIYQLDKQCINNYTPAFFKGIFAGGTQIRTDSVIEW